MLGGAQNLGAINGQGFIELQRITGAPEVVVGQQQLVDGGVDLNGTLQIQPVQPASGHVAQCQRGLCDHRKIRLGHRTNVLPCVAQSLVEPDHEVKQIQVMLEEQLVLDIVQRGGCNRVGGNLCRGIRSHKSQNV